MNTIENLRSQFAAELTWDEMKGVTGGINDGPCGVLAGDVWMEVIDLDGNGTTKEEALRLYDQGWAYHGGNQVPVIGWCCDSCPWNS